MPRFLKSRKARLLAVACGVLLLALLIYWRMYAIAGLLMAAYFLNRKIRRDIWLPKERLNARRKVETVKTLVIGDVCSRKILSRHCDLSKSMIITAPDRSLATSALLLDHLESVLCSDGTVVIVGSKHPCRQLVTAFDIPFIGLITALELGINRNSSAYAFPLLLHPVRCAKLLGGRRVRTVGKCPDQHIAALCKRKGFRLIYLE